VESQLPPPRFPDVKAHERCRFRTSAASAREALKVVKIVPPRPFTLNNDAGYLFVVRGTSCTVYSWDALHVTRADLPISDAAGEASFIYPAPFITDLDDDLAVVILSGENVFRATWNGGRGGSAERQLLNPKWASACDAELDAAVNPQTCPASVLREAVTVARSLKPTSSLSSIRTDPPPAIQVGPVRDGPTSTTGCVHASNGVDSISIFSPVFGAISTPLLVPGVSAPLLRDFLARCEGDVTIKTGATSDFAIDSRGRALGWKRAAKAYDTIRVRRFDRDTTGLQLSARDVLHAVRHFREALHLYPIVSFAYDGARAIRISAADVTSAPVSVTPAEDSRVAGFDVKIELMALARIFGTRSECVALRARALEPTEARPIRRVMLRTIDEYAVDGFPFRVERFCVSRSEDVSPTPEVSSSNGLRKVGYALTSARMAAERKRRIAASGSNE
jgi:hypothetical protein